MGLSILSLLLMSVSLSWATLLQKRHGSLHGLSYDQTSLIETAASASPLRIPPAFTIDMPIDHFNQSDHRTYKNRYWVNATFYKDGGPVFFYDVGETGVSNASVLVLLAEFVGPSAPMALARKYNGLAVMWEHRFYGESLPFPVDEVTGYARAGYTAYQYLTNEQVQSQVLHTETTLNTKTTPRAEMSNLCPRRPFKTRSTLLRTSSLQSSRTTRNRSLQPRHRGFSLVEAIQVR